jgi:hypothetical protein
VPNFAEPAGFCKPAGFCGACRILQNLPDFYQTLPDFADLPILPQKPAGVFGGKTCMLIPKRAIWASEKPLVLGRNEGKVG